MFKHFIKCIYSSNYSSLPDQIFFLFYNDNKDKIEINDINKELFYYVFAKFPIDTLACLNNRRL